jgi:hypothetical protein
LLERNDRFLDSVWKAYLSKRKALRHRGTITEEHGAESDPPGWFRIIFERANAPVVEIEIVADQTCNVYLCRHVKPNRWKKFLRIEGLRLIGNPTRIAEGIAWTCRESGYSAEAQRELRRVWRDLSLDMVK